MNSSGGVKDDSIYHIVSYDITLYHTHPTPKPTKPNKAAYAIFKNRIGKENSKIFSLIWNHTDIIHIMTDYRASVNHQRHETIQLGVVLK